MHNQRYQVFWLIWIIGLRLLEVYSENSENQRYTRIMDVEALNIEDPGLTIQVKNSILKKETLM